MPRTVYRVVRAEETPEIENSFPPVWHDRDDEYEGLTHHFDTLPEAEKYRQWMSDPGMGNGGEHHIWEGELHGPQQDDPDWKGGKLGTVWPRQRVAGQPAYVNQWIEDKHGPDEFHGHQSDCINPKCDAHFSPQTIHELEQYGEVKCPNCGTLQNILGAYGPYDEESYNAGPQARGNRPGGGTHAGLSLKEMGRIGQEVVKRAQIPGFTYQSEFHQPQWPIDQIWHDENGQPHGMEIKACHSMAQPRFKLGDARERQKKIQYCAENGLRQGLIGVRLNFFTNQADVFHRPQFTDTWVGAPTMMHAGTYDFSDLNPFKTPGEVPDNLPEEHDDIPF